MRTTHIKTNFAAILFVFGLTLFCLRGSDVYAIESSTFAASSTSSSVSIALEPTIDLELVPNTNGVAGYKTTNLTISTNRTNGFRVLLNTSDTATNLTNNLHAQDFIKNVTSPTEFSKLPVNSWGVYFGTTNPTDSSIFLPISIVPTELVHNELANASGTYKLAIGARADTSLPAGTYRNNLVISVIADPSKITSLADATYMQDVTSAICQNSQLEQGQKLIDSRDGKTYWVAKLADGNCWMQQNLDLELTLSGNNAAAIAKDGTKVVLTNENTDISTQFWNSSTGLAPSERLTVAPSTAYFDYDSTRSWDPGEIILTNPTGSRACNILSAGTALSTLPTSCSSYIKNVAGASPTYTATTTSSYNSTNNTYDAHYLFGNYYSYGAATAGTPSKTAGTNSPDSICPKGWRLPTDSERPLLKSAYLSTNFGASPLYFVRAGRSDPKYSAIKEVGNLGQYWTSTVNGAVQAADLEIASGIDWGNNGLYNGFSIRCVVK